MAVLQGGKKKGRNNEVTVLPRYLIAGSQCNAIFFFVCLFFFSGEQRGLGLSSMS